MKGIPFKESDIFVGATIDFGGNSLTIREEYVEFTGGIQAGSDLFHRVGLEDPFNVCTKIYGYKPGEGDFPEYGPNDMHAAYTILSFLYEKYVEMGLIKGVNKVIIQKGEGFTDLTVGKITLRIYGSPLYKIELKNELQRNPKPEPVK